jgi:hypothetical protein
VSRSFLEPLKTRDGNQQTGKKFQDSAELEFIIPGMIPGLESSTGNCIWIFCNSEKQPILSGGSI